MKIAASIEIVSLLILTVVSPFVFPQTVQATTNTQLRQEVNITDGYYYAASGATATTSELVSITDSNYSDPNYYFEVVASTTAGTNASVALVNPTTGATVASVTVNGGNTYTRYRSTQFLPSASTSVQYKVRLNGESIGKGIIAARVVVLQNTATLSNTETQIEIGNNETYTSTATSSLASPKYWYYNDAAWDGTKTFSASVTYANTVEPSVTVASSTTYSTNGTFTVVIPTGTASTSVQLWAGGGGGGAASVNTSGSGSGGAGGQYAKKTIASLGGLSKTLVVGGGGGGGVSTAAGTVGSDTTWDTNIVVAKGGAGGGADSGTAGSGSTASGVGDIVNAGGNGAAGVSSGTSGGGGGGAKSTGTGGNASGGTAGSGADGGTGGTGQSTNGTPATASAPGGGGAGGRSTSTANVNGGAGGIGQAIITDDITTTPTATTTIALQEDNGQFASWIDKAYLINNGTASSPNLTSAASFTPTDGKHYRIAFRNGYTGATFAIYNAKIIVDQQPDSTASYGSNNQNSFSSMSAGSSRIRTGETFTAPSSVAVTSATFDLLKSGSPTGNLTARLYALSGTFGTDAIPSGTALATSNTIDASTLSTSFQLITFTFSSPFTLTSATNYGIEIEFNSGDGSNFVRAGADNTPTYSGNMFIADASFVYSGLNTLDMIFYINKNLIITLLEPQYLLANTKYASGTSLQNFLTRFDPAEWTTTNNYLNAVSSGASSASVAGVYNAGTVLTNSTITSPNNYATSTLGICMPAVAADFDTKATTNNNDLYSDSIVVQVGVTSTAGSCTTGPAATGRSIVIIKAQMIVREPTVIK